MQVFGQYLRQSALFELESTLCQKARNEAQAFAAYLSAGSKEKTAGSEYQSRSSFNASVPSPSRTDTSGCEKTALKTFLNDTALAGTMCRLMSRENGQCPCDEVFPLKAQSAGNILLLQHLVSISLKEGLKLENRTLAELTMLCTLLKKTGCSAGLLTQSLGQQHTVNILQNCILPTFLPLCLLAQSRLAALRRLLLKRKSYRQRRREQENAAERERHDLMEQFCECFVR